MYLNYSYRFFANILKHQNQGYLFTYTYDVGTYALLHGTICDLHSIKQGNFSIIIQI